MGLVIKSGPQVGPIRRANAEPALTITRTGGAPMATEDPTPIPFVIVYTDKHRIPFIIDADDYEAVSRYFWCVYQGYPTTNIGKRPNGRAITLHQFLLGHAPEGFEWDHRDRDRLNNRRSNLRLATDTLNSRNRGIQKNNKSGVRGVIEARVRGRWIAGITVNGKRKQIGTFSTIEEAAAARSVGAEKYWRGDPSCQ